MDLKITYTQTLDDLLQAREFMGGDLPPGVEANYTSRLLELWEHLAPEAREELERVLEAPHQALG